MAGNYTVNVGNNTPTTVNVETRPIQVTLSRVGPPGPRGPGSAAGRLYNINSEYDVGDIVSFNNQLYVSLTGDINSGLNPDTDNVNWLRTNRTGVFDPNIMNGYAVGDIVSSNGNLYIHLTENASATLPENDRTNWQEVTAGGGVVDRETFRASLSPTSVEGGLNATTPVMVSLDVVGAGFDYQGFQNVVISTPSGAPAPDAVPNGTSRTFTVDFSTPDITARRVYEIRGEILSNDSEGNPVTPHDFHLNFDVTAAPEQLVWFVEPTNNSTVTSYPLSELNQMEDNRVTISDGAMFTLVVSSANAPRSVVIAYPPGSNIDGFHNQFGTVNFDGAVTVTDDVAPDGPDYTGMRINNVTGNFRLIMEVNDG